MKFLSIRDLRNKSSKVIKELAREKEIIITTNGKPSALLIPISGSNIEQVLSAIRQAFAMQAVASMQEGSIKKGTDTLTLNDINAEIHSERKRHF